MDNIYNKARFSQKSDFGGLISLGSRHVLTAKTWYLGNIYRLQRREVSRRGRSLSMTCAKFLVSSGNSTLSPPSNCLRFGFATLVVIKLQGSAQQIERLKLSCIGAKFPYLPRRLLRQACLLKGSQLVEFYSLVLIYCF
eukprot:RCo020668